MKALYHTDEEEDNQLDEVSHAQTLPQIPGAISDIPSNPPVNNHVLDTEPQVVHDTPMHTPVVEGDDICVSKPSLDPKSSKENIETIRRSTRHSSLPQKFSDFVLY